jgi:regulatory protein YycI of two-component signal transduction system YycFG
MSEEFKHTIFIIIFFIMNVPLLSFYINSCFNRLKNDYNVVHEKMRNDIKEFYKNNINSTKVLVKEFFKKNELSKMEEK